MIALGVLVGAAFALLRARARPSADPLGNLDPARAYAIALDLGGRGRHLESLPYWRQSLAGIATDSWEIHRNAAAAFNNAALEVRDAGGRAVPASRASLERVEMVRDALEQLVLAERLAPNAATRAAIIDARAQVFELWGLGADALELYRASLGVDPSSAAARAHAAVCAASLYGAP